MDTTAMTERLQDWQRRAENTARNVGSATDNYVHDHTWSTIGMAMVLGLVVGFLLSNRRD